MTIRKNTDTARSITFERGLLLAVTLTSLTACSSLSSVLEPARLDYKSASKSNIPSLEIPPDLTQLQRDSRYAIPENNRGTVTASTYSSQKPAASATTVAVAPNATPQARVERAGSQRWLVVKQTPEILWPQIKDFWQDNGFLIDIDNQQAGVMETDWAENRAKIPQDFIRNTIGKAFDSLYSTGERDKFRTRLERSSDGSTEIYISHRGAQEILVGQQKDGTVWTPRPADPGLEAEFLSRLLGRLGVEEVKAKAIVAQAAPQQTHAKLSKDSSSAFVEVDEPFDRSWRRVGLALDRIGFTVEDRDRAQGTYFVRYLDLDKDAQSKSASDKGFFSRIFSGSGSDNSKAKSAKRYRVVVKERSAVSYVTVQTNEGQPETSSVADRILALLNEQLK